MDYYDQISKGYDELHLDEQTRKLKIIKDKIKLNKRTKILDVGCGTGISSKFDCFVVGIDSSIKLLSLNKNKNKILGKSENLPFKDHFFDIIVSITAMQNFDDIVESIKEMKRVGNRDFVLSALKQSNKIDKIKEIIKVNFKIIKMVEEEKDFIWFLKTKDGALKHKIYR